MVCRPYGQSDILYSWRQSFVIFLITADFLGFVITFTDFPDDNIIFDSIFQFDGNGVSHAMLEKKN